jgi:hypothetical protein
MEQFHAFLLLQKEVCATEHHRFLACLRKNFLTLIMLTCTVSLSRYIKIAYTFPTQIFFPYFSVNALEYLPVKL